MADAFKLTEDEKKLLNTVFFTAGNIKMDKEKSTEKIDGAIATIMALDRAVRCGNDNKASIYEDRGLFIM